MATLEDPDDLSIREVRMPKPIASLSENIVSDLKKAMSEGQYPVYTVHGSKTVPRPGKDGGTYEVFDYTFA